MYIILYYSPNQLLARKVCPDGEAEQLQEDGHREDGVEMEEEEPRRTAPCFTAVLAEVEPKPFEKEADEEESGEP